jgi:CBS domain-containing protein
VINAIAADGGLLRLDSKLIGPKGFGLSLRRLINTCFTSTLSDLVHHRVAVTDPDGVVSHIVSQSDIVRFFLKNEDTFGNMKDMTVSKLRLGTKSVFTLPGSTPTFVAFMTLHSQKRTAAGVIESDGKLIGNLSKSDLRGLSPENFSLLTRPLSVFFGMDSTPNGKENDVSGSSTHQPESPVSPKEQLRGNSSKCASLPHTLPLERKHCFMSHLVKHAPPQQLLRETPKTCVYISSRSAIYTIDRVCTFY